MWFGVRIRLIHAGIRRLRAGTKTGTVLGRGVRPSSRAFTAQVFRVTKLLGWRISEGEPFLR